MGPLVSVYQKIEAGIAPVSFIPNSSWRVLLGIQSSAPARRRFCLRGNSINNNHFLVPAALEPRA